MGFQDSTKLSKVLEEEEMHEPTIISSRTLNLMIYICMFRRNVRSFERETATVVEYT